VTTDAIPWFDVSRGGARTDSVRLLRDGVEAFPVMLDAIAKAEREILLEMYWIGNDAVGARFRDALAARASAGVDVKVIYDYVGSFEINLAWWRPLVAAGGRVVEYHAIWPVERVPIAPAVTAVTAARRSRALAFVDRIERRDHRKVLVVDGDEGFTGGINLAKPWLAPDEGGAGWRDDVVQVRGGAAQELRTIFYKTWRRMTGEKAPIDVRALSRRNVGGAWVLASQWRTLRSIHREYVVRIKRARASVDIANSYFVPDRDVRRALFRAIDRGVRVRVLVPARSDVPLVQFATEALFDTLLRHGVELYALPGTMLHAKTAIIDDDFTTIGSYNLDERSWRKNLEVNLAVRDRAFARHVRGWFERDLARATRVDLASWRERAVARRGIELAAYALRRWW